MPLCFYQSLNKICRVSMQLCNHPMLSYPAVPGAPLDAATIAAECGKLVVLDRLLVKLRAAGHRILLFSTMTRLLDLLQASVHCRMWSMVVLLVKRLAGQAGGTAF